MRLPARLFWVLVLLLPFSACRIDGDALEKAFDGMAVEYIWTDGETRVELSGEFSANVEESDIFSLSPGGSLEVWGSFKDQDRHLKVGHDDSEQLTRSYSVEGVPQEFDSTARRWLSKVLPKILRETGFNSSQRVERILADKGPQGVLAEISAIESSYSRRTYIEELIGLHPPDPDLARKLVLEAAKIESSTELARALQVLVPIEPGDNEATLSLIEAAGSVQSSSSRRQVLESIVGAREIGSEAAAACVRSAGEIRSSSEKAAMLILLAESVGDDSEAQLAILEAAETIRSSFEKRRAVEAVVERGISSPAVFLAVSEVISGIASPSEKSMVLAELAEVVPGDDVEIVASFLEALASVRSVSGQERVLSRFLERQDLTGDVRSEVRTAIEQELPEGPIRSRLLEKASR